MALSSIHILPVTGGSEIHNERGKELEHVRDDLSHLNESESLESISTKMDFLRNLVKEKTGRKMQKSATPIREGVFLFEPHHTMDDAKKVARKIKEVYGIQTFQIHMHRDEGHYTESNEWKPNLHAHLVMDWTDHKTGKSIKLDKFDISEMQTLVSTELGMERGKSSSKKHIKHLQFKNLKEGEKNQRMKAKNKAGDELSKQIRSGAREVIKKNNSLFGDKINIPETQRNIEAIVQNNAQLSNKVNYLAEQNSQHREKSSKQLKAEQENSSFWKKATNDTKSRLNYFKTNLFHSLSAIKNGTTQKLDKEVMNELIQKTKPKEAVLKPSKGKSKGIGK